MSDRLHAAGEKARDGLTGLPGIAAVGARLTEWLAQAERSGEPAHVHAMQLGFRRLDAVNLAYGQAVGDAALAEVAARTSHFAASELDGPWLLARSGGSSFLLIANEACSRERWQLIAEQLADTVARPIATPSAMLRLSPRIVLLRGLTRESAESMLDRLGQGLVATLRLQGRRLNWADGEGTQPGRTAAQLEADILVAIDRGEIEVLFQPQYRLPDDRLVGAEALARWNHPTLGRMGAGALFAIADRADHVAPLSQHIAGLALAAAREWPQDLRLSLNVTAADLAAGNYAAVFLGVLRASGFEARRLTLEVTEQVLVGDIQLASLSLNALAKEDIRIALDDFGAGFCNFRYLKLLPLHYLKLDRSMIDGIASDPRDLAVLRAIVAMARALDLKVIAEGIENETLHTLIAKEGCASYQGFLRSQPMSALDFLDLTNSL